MHEFSYNQNIVTRNRLAALLSDYTSRRLHKKQPDIIVYTKSKDDDRKVVVTTKYIINRFITE